MAVAEEYDPDRAQTPELPASDEPADAEWLPKGNPTASYNKNSAKPPSYAVMILDAVLHLNDKNGISLNAIRKYILANFNISHKQTASFHSLTLKAVNRAVAAGELEKIKHSFRLSDAERERRTALERKALGSSMMAFELVSAFESLCVTFAHGVCRDQRRRDWAAEGAADPLLWMSSSQPPLFQGAISCCVGNC